MQSEVSILIVELYLFHHQTNSYFRDSSVKLAYKLISESSFANRHSVAISWSKPQELPAHMEIEGIDIASQSSHFMFYMRDVATPDPKQSEAFIATIALFIICGTSTKEEKVSMRLPATWRDLWAELAKAKQDRADAEDREAIRKVRTLVRDRQNQELEDGVVLQGAFRKRGAARNTETGDDAGQDKAKRGVFDPESYRRIWAAKCSTPSYKAMLVSIGVQPPKYCRHG